MLFSSFVYAQSISPSQIGSTILGNSDDRFGFSVSLSDQGNTLVVGAPYDSNFKGKIYVYKLIDGDWQLIQNISGQNSGDEYGYDVSLSGDGNVLAIGTPGFDTSFNLKYFNITQNATQTFSISESSSYSDSNGETAIGQNVGTTYIYDFNTNSNSFTYRNNIHGSPSTGRENGYGSGYLNLDNPSDLSGSSIALNYDGSRIVIGEPGWDIGNNSWKNGGRIRVFDFDGNSWNLLSYVNDLHSGSITGYRGTSVAINSEGNLVGAGEPGFYSDNNSITGGRSVMFEYYNNTWNRFYQQTRSDKSNDIQYMGSDKILNGYSVSISEDEKFLTTQPGEGLANIIGSFFIYDYSNITSNYTTKTPSTREKRSSRSPSIFKDRFGYTSAISDNGDYAIVSDKNAIYFYSIEDCSGCDSGGSVNPNLNITEKWKILDINSFALKNPDPNSDVKKDWGTSYGTGTVGYNASSLAVSKQGNIIAVGSLVDSNNYTGKVQVFSSGLLFLTLSDSDSDNIVSNSDVVTITAAFSESMSATPTISLTGIVSNALMSATATTTTWTYAWTVSGTSVASTTATISGTDLSGSVYSGAESLTFTIDNSPPTVILTTSDSDYIVSNSDVVTITATFSESMAATPTLSLSGIVANAQMNATASDTVWTYVWTVSTNEQSVVATVAGSDVVGNFYNGNTSLTFGLRNLGFNIIEGQLIAWYPFNGNANDESGKLNNGTNNGGALALDRNGIPNTAYYFSGENCSTRIDANIDTSEISSANAFSVSVWFYNEGEGCNGPRVLEFWPGSDAAGKFVIDLGKNSSNGTYTPFVNYLTDQGGMNLNWTFEDKKWTHLVYTIDANNYKLYQNGDLIGTGVTSGTISLATEVSFGRMNHPANDAINGYLDDIGVWSKALTQQEVSTLYQDSIGPIVTLSDSDTDNIVFNTDVVTITATFSESMSATPTISLSGIVSNTQMNATASNTIWTYTWTVSTSVISTTATVSGTDSSGNAYSGTDSITFTIQSKSFSKVESGSFLKIIKTTNEKFLATKLSDNTSSNGNNYLYQSSDLLSWTQFSSTFDVNVTRGTWYGFHKDQNDILYLATKDNGIYKSNNNGSAWVSIGNGGYGTGATDITSTSSYTFSLSTGSVRGIYRTSDQTNWVKIKNDNLDMADLVVGSDNTVYSITTTKRLFESQTANTSSTNVSWTENTSEPFSSKVILVENLNNKVHLIDENGNVFRKDSSTWNTISNIPFTTTEQAYLNQLIQTSNTSFWLGTINNGVWYSDNAGISWINYSNVYSGTFQGIFTENNEIVITTTEGIYSTGSVDIVSPQVTLNTNDPDKIVKNNDIITISALFSEVLTITPTISLSGIATNVAMSSGKSVILKSNNQWQSSTGSFQDFNGNSGSNPYLGDDVLIFSYIDNATVYKTFSISSGATSITLNVDYKQTYNQDTGKVNLKYYDSNSNLISSTTSSDLTGTSSFQTLNINSLIPSGAVSLTVELTQTDESEFWAGNYGIQFKNFQIFGIENETVLSSPNEWTYTWNVSTTLTSSTATISATDNAGNSYIGTESLTFTIDNVKPYIVSNSISNTFNNGIISGSVTNTITIIFNEKINANTFTVSDVTIVPSGYFSITEKQSTDDITFVGTFNMLSPYTGLVTFTLISDSIEDIAGNTNSVSATLFNSDASSPTVTLTDTDADDIVSNSDVVTITATFSEGMTATPTLSLTGIISNALMSATASDSTWTYSWTVSGSTVSITTATVSGTDLAGNAYAGTESITFTIDNSNPTLDSFTDNDENNFVNDATNVTLTATFSEPMASSPELSISGLVTNTAMTVSASTNSRTWTYLWDVPSGNDGTYFATVSATDLIGNRYTGTESITFVVDNTAPFIQSVTVTQTNSKVILTYSEPIQLYDPTYLASNFSITKSGGTATVSNTGYSFSTTESNTIMLNIAVTGEPTGDELLKVGPTGASTLIDRAGNYALDYADSNQTSNTAYLTNTPPRFASTTVSSNNTSITIVFSEGVTADANGTELSNTDFTLAVSEGEAVLASATPSALSKTDSITYVLTISFSTPPNGAEILKVIPISSAVFDAKGTQIDLTAAQSNTVQLNDKSGPTITGATIDTQNRYVDITFSEGVYATASPTTAVTSSSFTLSQQSGPSYGMTISSISTTAAGILVGGETTVRFNLGSTVKPTGQEVFAITATDSSSVVDVSGNSMTVTQTNNTFQLKPPTSGGVSPQRSTITVAPTEMIVDGTNTAVISLQAKDSLGQNFFEGGYQINIYGPDGDLNTTDNQNGTYSASYTPETLNQDQITINFGFRVADTNSVNTAELRLYLDSDGDGVYNVFDECPGTEQGLEVNETGCALNQIDSDNDGVFDDVDACPDTPASEINNVQGTATYGLFIPTVVDEKGCGASQRDTDGDGILDTEDNCIDTANPDQADSDGDGIGDVCDTDNPLPQITSTSISFVQLPENGSVIGKIVATDKEGEALTFSKRSDVFDGILAVGSDGSISVVAGTLLAFDSNYNGSLLLFTVSDGTNNVQGSLTISIEDGPRPPEISIITFEVSEDAEVGTLVGLVETRDPLGGPILAVTLSGDGFIELVGGKELRTAKALDYEENTSHSFIISAQGEELTGTKEGILQVSDIPNATYTGRFFLSVFNVLNETLGAKVDHSRYFNPLNKNVGKWKVKKTITGGADADKFVIKTRSKSQQKGGDPIEDENEDYLEFITAPDFENPTDHNKDNVYEVEVEYLNTDDGKPEVPVVVTQTQIQVPEGKTTTIELQSQPVLPTEDTDGDGIVDVFDNSPLVANPDQADEDGDGVGDVTDDFDHDGVWNPFDTCPDTPLGELVDLNGCLIYFLPASNFTVSKTEKCAGENQINIGVVDTSVTYNVTLSGAVNQTDSFNTSNWTLEGLSAGVYTLCITVDGVDPNEFERCFEVTITEPDPLVVSSFFNKEDQTVSFDLSGGSTYQITQNGKTTQTSSSKYTVQLEKGVNTISISTGIECQGLFTQSYLKSYEVQYAPNPFKGYLQLYFGGEDTFIELGVYAPNGQLIEYENIVLPFGVRTYSLQTDHYQQGAYILKVKGETIDQSIQLIKE